MMICAEMRHARSVVFDSISQVAPWRAGHESGSRFPRPEMALHPVRCIASSSLVVPPLYDLLP